MYAVHPKAPLQSDSLVAIQFHSFIRQRIPTVPPPPRVSRDRAEPDAVLSHHECVYTQLLSNLNGKQSINTVMNELILPVPYNMYILDLIEWLLQ